MKEKWQNLSRAIDNPSEHTDETRRFNFEQSLKINLTIALYNVVDDDYRKTESRCNGRVCSGLRIVSHLETTEE